MKTHKKTLATALLMSAVLATPIFADYDSPAIAVTQPVVVTPLSPSPAPILIGPRGMLGSATTASEAFTRHLDPQGNVTSITVYTAGIRSSNAPFELLSAQVSADAIVLEVAPLTGEWFAPLPLDRMSVSVMHTIDGQDPFLDLDHWDDTAWTDRMNAILSTFSVAEQGFTAELNSYGNTEITLHVPTGAIDLPELGHLHLSYNLVLDGDTDYIDWEAFDWSRFFSFTLATSEFGVGQLGFPILQPSDFDTTLDFVLHSTFAHGRGHLLPMVQPLDITLVDGSKTLRVLASLGESRADSGSANFTTIVSLTGANIATNEWGHSDGLLLGPALDDTNWFGEVGVATQFPDARLIHVDTSTDTAYFSVNHSVNFTDWQAFDETDPWQRPVTGVVPDSLGLNLVFEQLISGRDTDRQVLDADIVAILQDHTPTLVPRSVHEQSYVVTLTGRNHPGLENHLGIDPEESWRSWELLNDYLEHVSIPAHGELNIPLAEGIYLSNVAIQNDLLWVQLQEPQQTVWGDFTSPDVWVHIDNANWGSNSPQQIFSLGFGEIDADGWHIDGDRFTNFVFSFDELADLHDLEIVVTTSAYNQFVDLDFRTQFQVPIVQDGFFAAGPVSVPVGDTMATVTNLHVGSRDVQFQLEGLRLPEQDFNELFTIQWLTADGVSEPVVFENRFAPALGQGHALMSSVVFEMHGAELALEDLEEPILHDPIGWFPVPGPIEVEWDFDLFDFPQFVSMWLPWSDYINPLELIGVVINGVTIQ